LATRKKTASTAPTSDQPTGNPSLDDLGRLIQKYQLPGIDVAPIVEAQRRDMEALAEANRLAFEGIKALSERRTEMLTESLTQWRAALQGATGEGGVAQVGEAVKQGVQQAAAHFRELAELEAQTRNDAWKVVQDRFQENVANLQKLLQPK
jgi:phasin family protein